MNSVSHGMHYDKEKSFFFLFTNLLFNIFSFPWNFINFPAIIVE